MEVSSELGLEQYLKMGGTVVYVGRNAYGFHIVARATEGSKRLVVEGVF
jgi:hypothetical protein